MSIHVLVIAISKLHMLLYFDANKVDAKMQNAVDGGWSDWTGWSDCNCNKERAMQRKCDSPAPAYGGATCTGLSQQTETCTPHGSAHCPGTRFLQQSVSIAS